MIARLLRHLRLRRAIRAMNATDRRYGGDDALIARMARREAALKGMGR